MKKVKIMLSAILIMAIVAGALAYKVEADDVCAYTKTITAAMKPATTICDRIHASTTYTTAHTVIGLSHQYASLIAKETIGTPCPLATLQCPQSRTIEADE